MNRLYFVLLLSITGLFSSCMGYSQEQAVDLDYEPTVAHPLFKSGEGPLILIDGGHYNFHTLEDKFAPFAQVARLNGFRVESLSGPTQSEHLATAKILVIANALNEKNVDNWSRPVYPAFSKEEIEIIRSWVWKGGNLFLIADHMPFAGAVADLAQSMGFTLIDGFAYCKPNQKFDIFSLENGMLLQTELSEGLDSIVSFTGHAFSIPDSSTSVITLDERYKLLMPERAWEFSRDMEMLPAGGLSQLAYSRYGSGKIVVAGEAAMFTAQKAGDIKFGLNAPFAPHNLPLLNNILSWLSK